jgi:hypothetical protein
MLVAAMTLVPAVTTEICAGNVGARPLGAEVSEPIVRPVESPN